MKIIFRTLLLFFLSVEYNNAISQNISISGYIYDSKNKESLADVSIWENQTKQSTTTNKYGFFNLLLDTSTLRLPYKIIISFVGYKKDTLVVQHNKNTIVNIFHHSHCHEH